MSEEYPATTLLLIRHALAAGSSHLGPCTPIGDLGRLQITALVSKLAEAAPLAVVFTSPLPRAVQTASLVYERLGLKVILDSRLTEFEMGTQEMEVILRRPALLIWHPEHRAADGETLREFAARVAAFCDEVVERHPDERVAVVSHAGTIDATLRWALRRIVLGNRSSTSRTPRSPSSSSGLAAASGASRYAVLQRIGDGSE